METVTTKSPSFLLVVLLLSNVGNGVQSRNLTNDFFQTADANGDGYLEKSELIGVQEELKGMNTYLQDMFSHIDTDGDQRITLLELVDAKIMDRKGLFSSLFIPFCILQD